METLIRITSSYFCCGVIAKNGKITETAPIVKYMIGWDAQKFVNYCKSKNFNYEKL